MLPPPHYYHCLIFERDIDRFAITDSPPFEHTMIEAIAQTLTDSALLVLFSTSLPLDEEEKEEFRSLPQLLTSGFNLGEL